MPFVVDDIVSSLFCQYIYIIELQLDIIPMKWLPIILTHLTLEQLGYFSKIILKFFNINVIYLYQTGPLQ